MKKIDNTPIDYKVNKKDIYFYNYFSLSGFAFFIFWLIGAININIDYYKNVASLKEFDGSTYGRIITSEKD